MIEIYKLNRFSLIDIEHLGLVKEGTDEIIKECLFLSMDGTWGNCFYEGVEFVLGAMTKVNLKE